METNLKPALIQLGKTLLLAVIAYAALIGYSYLITQLSILGVMTLVPIWVKSSVLLNMLALDVVTAALVGLPLAIVTEWIYNRFALFAIWIASVPIVLFRTNSMGHYFHEHLSFEIEAGIALYIVILPVMGSFWLGISHWMMAASSRKMLVIR